MEGEFGMRRWLVAVVALVAAVGIGVIAYQAGVAHGIAITPQVSAPAAPGGGQAAPAPAPYPYYAYRYYGPWHFAPFGFFGPLLGILFFIFVLRFVFWGIFGWGWRRRWWRYDPYFDPRSGPDGFDEWHRRAHDRMRDDRAPAPPSA